MSFEEFLKEVGPLLGLQWRPFQRRGVKRKVERRLLELGLTHLGDYLFKVRNDPEERDRLSQILTVTISRFFRDREVFEALEKTVLPSILKNKERREMKVWSIGCASGEEPYSLSILWRERFEKHYPEVRLTVLATDIRESLLERATAGIYKKSSLKEIPSPFLTSYFTDINGSYLLDRSLRESVTFRRENILQRDPYSGMHLVFCRNVAFTYFIKPLQVAVLKKIASSLSEEGYLVIGKEESLPLTFPTLFVPVLPDRGIYQKFLPHP
ncbi:MAG: protein-glutamate O-methyltransferase CheR [Desulfobacterota bacterium]|nr:protein-glutamate O-methyltransferase CheR [Thermodesulfobacteriota bacterium]